MIARANYQKLSHNSYEAMLLLEKTLTVTAVEKTITDLLKIRISAMNGCLFCLDMHSKEAKVHGERELRLYHLNVWRESELFSLKERAALEWAELLTRPGSHGASDEDYERASSFFNEKDLSDLTFAIASINAWNRLGVAFRSKPGAFDKFLGLDKAGLV